MKFNFDIIIKTKKWLEFSDINNEKNIKDIINNICQNLIKHCPVKKLQPEINNIEIAISLLNNQQIKKINHKYRNKNSATNVLSFPMYSVQELQETDFSKKADKYIFLGDIILSFEKIKQESKVYNKDLKKHLTHLILHSILHLLGFDHDSEFEANIMENLEIKILNKINISNPY